MALLSEWAEFDHTSFNNTKQEIPPKNNDFFEKADKKIKKLVDNGQINPQQKKALEFAKECTPDLCPNNFKEQMLIFDLEIKKILGAITIGEDIKLTSLEIDPKSYCPDTDNIKDVRTAILNIYKKEKNSIDHLLHPHK